MPGSSGTLQTMVYTLSQSVFARATMFHSRVLPLKNIARRSVPKRHDVYPALFKSVRRFGELSFRSARLSMPVVYRRKMPYGWHTRSPHGDT